jgi:hypothetical protein
MSSGFGEERALPWPVAAFARRWTSFVKGRNAMFVLLVILLVLVFAAAPAWPYSRGWGYYPSGGVGLVLLVLLVLLLTGYVRI